MKKFAVIVDAYGPAKHYIRFFNAKGIDCIHVQSTLTPLAALKQFHPEDYIFNIIHRGDLQETIESLTQSAGKLGGQIVCVLPGIEPGVELADQLSHHMDVVSNNIELSAARRDKYLMTEALTKNMVPTVKYSQASQLSEILTWIEKDNENHYPVVLKPLNSAGSDGVFICRDQKEVEKAFLHNVGMTNILGKSNDKILVQSFLKGREYIVNTVSCQGKHYVSDMWKSTKILLEGAGFIYDKEEIIPMTTSIAQEIRDYCFSVLNALDIQYGPAHIEIMYTDEGPILIEIGARMGGGVNPDLANLCVGHNQVELAVDAYVDAAMFNEKTINEYSLMHYGMWVILASSQAGIIREIPFIDNIKQLPSFHDMSMRVNVGGLLRKTVDLNSSPGSVYLVNHNQQQLQADYLAIKNMLATGFIVDEQV